MIQDICKDEAFLAQKAESAAPDDIRLPPICWKHSNITRTAAWAWQPT